MYYQRTFWASIECKQLPFLGQMPVRTEVICIWPLNTTLISETNGIIMSSTYVDATIVVKGPRNTIRLIIGRNRRGIYQTFGRQIVPLGIK